MNPLTLDPLEFPLHGSRLIEASAGTGKTYTIALLYVRLVLGHGKEHGFERPLLPPEILVVTFTDAATQELRDRIRERLVEAARCFNQPNARHDRLLEQLREDYDAAQWPVCARRLQLAVEWMDEAAVSTIHGWCYRMLREHAFDSGSLFSQTLQTDQSELLAQVLRDYWRRHYYPLNGTQAQVVAGYFDSPQALGKALSPVLGRRDACYRFGSHTMPAGTGLQEILWPAADFLVRQAELEQQARTAWRTDRKQIEALLLEVQHKLNGTSYKNAKDDSVFHGWLEALGRWSEGAAPPKNLKNFAVIKVNGKEPRPEHPAFSAIGDLLAHAQACPDIRPQLLLHALNEVRQRFDAEKLRRAEIGFDDLLSRLDAALQGPSGPQLAQTLRRQYPVALIDEFQDTDPVQYRIFESIYRIAKPQNDCGLFMIGDPKQAIYSFRGADIFTYLEARKATQGRHYTLGTNYRSTRAMVAAANRCFAFAEQHPRGAFRFAGGEQGNPVPFLPVAANGRDAVLLIDGQKQPALTFWHLPAEPLLSKQRYLQQMSEAAASAIQSWLDPKAGQRSGFQADTGQWTCLQPADIAILVRNRQEADAIRQALFRRRLASVYLSDRDSVFASEQALDLLFILRACAAPANDRLLRAALATGSVGLGWAELEQLNHDELHWERQVLRFADYRQLWQQQGVLPMLRKLLADFQVPARLLQNFNGERSLTNLLHLAEWLQRSASELDGEQALIRHLAEQIEDGSEEEVLRLESDAELIKVITVHKSKGLEYPLVLLPFVCAAREIDGKNKSPTLYHDADSGQLMIEMGISEMAKPARDQANEERLSEEMRLLYVALTRARYATWLGIGPICERQNKELRTSISKSGLGYLLAADNEICSPQIAGLTALLAEGFSEIVSQPAPLASDACHPPAVLPEPAAALMPRHKPAHPWWIASYSALTFADGGAALNPGLEPSSALEANLKEEADENAQTAGVDIHGFPRGAGPGTFLHGLLEWAGREGFNRVAQDRALLESTIAKRCNLRDWERWIHPLTAWLGRYLQTPLAFAGEQVSLAQLCTYQVEMEFWFSTSQVSLERLDHLVKRYTCQQAPRPALHPGQLNGLFKGFIDLSFEYQGRYYVADYKSNWLGPDAASYDSDSMTATILDKRYDLQFCLYMLALHRQLRLRLPDYDYDRHMGGAVYLFLRGHQADSQGVYFEKPPRELIEQMDALFKGQPVGISA